MQRILTSLFVLGLVLFGATAASAQGYFYCVKPDGAPVASIVLPAGAGHDPSVVCNAVVPQCFLTCSAVLEVHSGQAVLPPDLPSVTVTPHMLANLGGASPETPALCDEQYRQCVARCRGDHACQAYCQSVRSGCGTANSGR